MEEEKQMLYFFPKTDERPDLLIFDSGHQKGFVFIYEKKEERRRSEIDDLVEKYDKEKRGMAWELHDSHISRTW